MLLLNLGSVGDEFTAAGEEFRVTDHFPEGHRAHFPRVKSNFEEGDPVNIYAHDSSGAVEDAVVAGAGAIANILFINIIMILHCLSC